MVTLNSTDGWIKNCKIDNCPMCHYLDRDYCPNKFAPFTQANWKLILSNINDTWFLSHFEMINKMFSLVWLNTSVDSSYQTHLFDYQ